MLQNKVLVLGVNVVLAVLLALTTESCAQLAPADRPPPPPPPPPAIRFGQSGTPRPYKIPEKLRYQLIPVAPQQSARSPPRGQPRSISTHPAVSLAGYAQSPIQPQANLQRTVSTQTRFAQPQTTVGYVQPQRTVPPSAVSTQPQRNIQPHAGNAQSQRTVIPQAVLAQSQRTIQPYIQTQRAVTPLAGFVQPQRTLTGSITSHPAESHAQSQRTNQQQAVFARPQRIKASQPSFAPSLRTNPPYTSSPQPQSGYTQLQRLGTHQR